MLTTRRASNIARFGSETVLMAQWNRWSFNKSEFSIELLPVPAGKTKIFLYFGRATCYTL